MRDQMVKKKLDITSVTLTVNGYQLRTELLRGQEHWVLPVVMMVEGVHHGSLGPLLYTSEELGKVPGSWNGIPITVEHPQLNGEFTSANLPELVDEVVGNVFHAKMEGSKLKAEAWINIAHLKSVSEKAYEYIKEQKALEVSVGVFSEEINTPGDFNGEEYRAAATNLRPDHLALLPGEQGACSWDDGCGIRVNAKTKTKNMSKTKISKVEHVNALLEQGFVLTPVSNEAGYREIMQKVQGQLNTMDNGMKYHYLEDLFDDTFVYRVSSNNNQPDCYYKQAYTLAANDSVEFTDSPVMVRKETSFVAMKLSRTKINQTKTENKMTRKLNSNKECTCNVDALIANEATQFTEEDRTWLSTLKQEQLEKLMPVEVEKEEVEEVAANTSKTKVKTEVKKEVAANTEKSLVSTDEDGAVLINGKTIDTYIKESLSKETDTNKFIDNFMPEGLKGQMKAGLKMYQDNRKATIKAIVDNSKFKEAQLKDWKDEDLSALHESVVGSKANYSLAASADHSSAGADDHGGEQGADSNTAITAMLSFEQKPKKASTEKKEVAGAK